MKLEDLGYNKKLEQLRIENKLEEFEIGRIISEHKERYVVKTGKGEFGKMLKNYEKKQKRNIKVFKNSAIRTWDTIQRLRFISGFVLILAALLFTAFDAKAQTEWSQIVASKDGTLISYEVYGTGEPTLVFVHGLSCDSRYWRNQIPVFSLEHKVVVLDLAGHGHSGVTRETYSMEAFGADVQSVVEVTGSQNVILIGHSMGGAIIAEAARLMPQRVKGIIGIDTFENIEYPLSREELNIMLAPLQKDYQSGMCQFVQQMLSPNTDAKLREWIIADMSAAPPSIALSTMEEALLQSVTGQAAKIFEEIHIPVMTVNGDLWPIDYEANRRHMFSFDAIVIKKADHFLMMNRSDEFNKALKQAIKSIVENIKEPK
jgi:pimeloyl-ACP methyl ester carboxylesterase